MSQTKTVGEFYVFGWSLPLCYMTQLPGQHFLRQLFPVYFLRFPQLAFFFKRMVVKIIELLRNLKFSDQDCGQWVYFLLSVRIQKLEFLPNYCKNKHPYHFFFSSRLIRKRLCRAQSPRNNLMPLCFKRNKTGNQPRKPILISPYKLRDRRNMFRQK